MKLKARKERRKKGIDDVVTARKSAGGCSSQIHQVKKGDPSRTKKCKTQTGMT